MGFLDSPYRTALPGAAHAAGQSRRRVEIYEVDPKIPTDPFERSIARLKRQQQEGRDGLFGKVLELVMRLEAPMAGTIHRNYLQAVAKGHSPNFGTWLGALAETVSSTPAGIPTAAVIGGAIGGPAAPVGALIGAGIGAAANVAAFAYDPKEYLANVQQMLKGYRGLVRAGDHPVDFGATLQEAGVPLVPSMIGGFALAILNPLDPTNYIGSGVVKGAAKLPLKVSGRVLDDGRFIRKALGGAEEIAGEAVKTAAPEARIGKVFDLPLSQAGAKAKADIAANFMRKKIEALGAKSPEELTQFLDAAQGRLSEAIKTHGPRGEEFNVAFRTFLDEMRRFGGDLPSSLTTIQEFGPEGKALIEMQRPVYNAIDTFEGLGGKSIRLKRTRFGHELADDDVIGMKLRQAGRMEDFDEYKRAVKWLEDPERTFKHVMDPTKWDTPMRDYITLTLNGLLPIPSKRFPFIARPFEVPLSQTLWGKKWRFGVYGSIGAAYGGASIEAEDTPLEAAKKVLISMTAAGLFGSRALRDVDRGLARAVVALQNGMTVPAAEEAKIDAGLIRRYGSKGLIQIAKGGQALLGTVQEVMGRSAAAIGGQAWTNSPAHYPLVKWIRQWSKDLSSVDSFKQIVAFETSRDVARVYDMMVKMGVPVEEIDGAKLFRILNNILERKDVDLWKIAREAAKARGGTPADVITPGTAEDVGPIDAGTQTPVPEPPAPAGGPEEVTPEGVAPSAVEAAPLAPSGTAGPSPPAVEPPPTVPTPPHLPPAGVAIDNLDLSPEETQELLDEMVRINEELSAGALPQRTTEATSEIDRALDAMVAPASAYDQQLADLTRAALDEARASGQPTVRITAILNRVAELAQERLGITIPRSIDSPERAYLSTTVGGDLRRQGKAGTLRIRLEGYNEVIDLTGPAVQATPTQAAREPTQALDDWIRETPSRHVEGANTSVRIPQTRDIPARYGLVEADDLLASHSRLVGGKLDLGDTSLQGKGYPGDPDAPAEARNINSTRNYANDPEFLRQLGQLFGVDPAHAEAFNPALVIDTSITPDTGPPIAGVFENRLVVLGGNKRTAFIQKLFADAPETFRERYIQRLRETLPSVGIPAEALNDFTHPVLVRLMEQIPSSPSELRALASELNTVSTAGSNAVKEMAARLGGLSKPKINELTEIFEQLPDEGALTTILQSPLPVTRNLIQWMRENSILRQTELGAALKDTKDAFTEAGAIQIKNMLEGMILNDDAARALIGERVRAGLGLMKSSRHILRAAQSDPLFLSRLNQTLRYYKLYLESGLPLNQWKKELLLAGGDNWNQLERAQKILFHYFDENSTATNRFQEGFQKYADFWRAQAGETAAQGRLFDVPETQSPEAAFEAAFRTEEGAKALGGLVGSAREEYARNLLAVVRGETKTKFQKTFQAAWKKGKLPKITEEQVEPFLEFYDTLGRGAMRARPDLFKTLDDWYKYAELMIPGNTAENMAEGVVMTISRGINKLIFYSNASFAALIHEPGHLLRDILSEPEIDTAFDVYDALSRSRRKQPLGEELRKVVRRGPIQGAYVQSLADAKFFEESFARDIERYMTIGKAPNDELKPLFEKIARWMRAEVDVLATKYGWGSVEKVTAKQIPDAATRIFLEELPNFKLNPRIRDIFDRYLGVGADQIAEVKQLDPMLGRAYTREELIGHYAFEHNVNAAQAQAALDAPDEDIVQWLESVATQYGSAEHFYAAKAKVFGTSAKATPVGSMVRATAKGAFKLPGFTFLGAADLAHWLGVRSTRPVVLPFDKTDPLWAVEETIRAHHLQTPLYEGRISVEMYEVRTVLPKATGAVLAEPGDLLLEIHQGITQKVYLFRRSGTGEGIVPDAPPSVIAQPVEADWRIAAEAEHAELLARLRAETSSLDRQAFHDLWRTAEVEFNALPSSERRTPAYRAALSRFTVLDEIRLERDAAWEAANPLTPAEIRQNAIDAAADDAEEAAQDAADAAEEGITRGRPDIGEGFDPARQSANAQKSMNQQEGAGVVKREAGIVTRNRIDPGAYDDIAARSQNDFENARMQGDVTPPNILAQAMTDDAVKMVLARAMGQSVNAEQITSTLLRSTVELEGVGDHLMELIKAARKEFGIADDTEDLLLGYVAPLLGIRHGYRAIHMQEQFFGIGTAALDGEMIHYSHLLFDDRARAHLSGQGFMEPLHKRGQKVGVVLPASWRRQFRPQFFLGDARFVHPGELGQPTGLMLDEAFIPFDAATLEAFQDPEAPKDLAAFFSQKDDDLRKAFGMSLPEDDTTESLLKDDSYFRIRMSSGTVSYNGQNWYVMEMPSGQTPMTVKNALYRSGTLRLDTMENALNLTPEALAQAYPEMKPSVVKSLRGEPLYVTDPALAFAARAANSRKTALNADLLNRAMSDPAFSVPAMTTSPDDWVQDLAVLLGKDFDDERSVASLMKNYVLANAGGNTYFVVKRPKPLSTPSSEIVDLSDVFEIRNWKGIDPEEAAKRLGATPDDVTKWLEEDGTLGGRHQFVYTKRDAKGKRLPWTGWADQKNHAGPQHRLRDDQVRDMMSYRQIKSILEDPASTDAAREGAERALRIRSSALRDPEAARLLDYTQKAYVSEGQRFRGIGRNFWQRFTELSRETDPVTGEWIRTRKAAWGEAIQELKQVYDVTDFWKEPGALTQMGLETLSSVWARLTIAGWPNSRVRDLLGNVFMHTLGGMHFMDPAAVDSYVEAGLILRGNKVNVSIGGVQRTSEELLRQSRMHALTGSLTGTDVALDDSWDAVQQAIYRGDTPHDTKAFVDQTLFGVVRDATGKKRRFVGMNPTTGIFYRNVLIPAAAGAAGGAALEQGDVGDRAEAALKGAALVGGLGTFFGVARLAAGRAGNRFSIGSVDFRNAAKTNRWIHEPYAGTDSGWTYYVRRVSQNGEDIQRMAYWLFLQKKGFNEADAARKVHDVIFSAASVPQGWLKYRKYMPFMRWTAFNVPNQFKGLLENPRMMFRIARGVGEMQNNYEASDRRYIPEFVQGQPHIAWAKDPKTGEGKYYVLGNWIPQADLLQWLDPKNLPRTVMGMITPVLIEGAQQMANRDFYFESPIDKIDARGGGGMQVEQFAGFNMKSRVTHFLGTAFRFLKEVDRVSQKDPFRFLESRATETERRRREKELDYGEVTRWNTITLFQNLSESGFGYMPRSYEFGEDRQKRVVVRRVKDTVSQARQIASRANYLASPAARAAQMREVLSPFHKHIPGFRTTPTSVMSPGDLRRLRRMMEELETQEERRPTKSAAPRKTREPSVRTEYRPPPLAKPPMPSPSAPPSP